MTKSSKSETKSVKRWVVTGSCVGLLFIVGLGVLGKNGVLDLFQLKSLHQTLQKENLSLLQEQEQLRQEIMRLKDGRYVEFLARERLGLMGSKEFFLILDGPNQNSQGEKKL